MPQPSYPLFELLTSLEGVDPVPYRLEHHGAGRSIAQPGASTHAAHAGRAGRQSEQPDWIDDARRRSGLADRTCAPDRGVAIIADEVFADYPLMPRSDGRRLAGDARALTFSLGGLSKSAGLPQLKLGWIIVSGPDELARDAIDRLEVICDTYLSVSTPVQVAAARLIESGRLVRGAICARIAANLRTLHDRLRSFAGRHAARTGRGLVGRAARATDDDRGGTGVAVARRRAA